MRWLLTVTVFFGAFVLAGCNKQPKNDILAMEEASESGFDQISAAPVSSGDIFPAVMSEAESSSYPATEMAAVPRTYTIQPRDTLWSIAKRYYGQGKRWREIAQLNPGLAPERLPIGQPIYLP